MTEASQFTSAEQTPAVATSMGPVVVVKHQIVQASTKLIILAVLLRYTLQGVSHMAMASFLRLLQHPFPNPEAHQKSP